MNSGFCSPYTGWPEYKTSFFVLSALAVKEWSGEGKRLPVVFRRSFFWWSGFHRLVDKMLMVHTIIFTIFNTFNEYYIWRQWSKSKYDTVPFFTEFILSDFPYSQSASTGREKTSMHQHAPGIWRKCLERLPAGCDACAESRRDRYEAARNGMWHLDGPWQPRQGQSPWSDGMESEPQWAA